MSKERSCYACSEPLIVLSKGEARCTPNCPGGGRFARCGFCHQVSFALGKPDTPFCYNPECRMFQRARRRCEECRQVSRIEINGGIVCLNRRCKRNEGRLAQCDICAHEGRNEASFTEVNGIAFCGRGACSALLIPVEDCGYCGKRTLSTEDGQCIYPECEVYGLVQQPCPNCGGPALEDPESGAVECQKPECGEEPAPAFDPASSGAEMTIMDLWATSPPADEPAEPAASLDEGDPLMTLPAIDAPGFLDTPPAEEAVPSHEQETINVARAEDGPLSTTEDLDTSDISDDGGDVLLETSGPDEVLVEESLPPQPKDPAPPQREPDDLGVTILEHLTPAPGDAPTAQEVQEKIAELPGPPPAETSPASAAGFGGSIFDRMSEAVDATPAPAATAPAAPAAAPPPPDGSALGKALGALEEDLAAEGKAGAPLAVIIGAVGSGKTTFLTMLGHVLAAREAAYHFPYRGVTLRRFGVNELLERRKQRRQPPPSDDVAAAIQATVRDLAYEFAQPLFDGSLGIGAWPPPTRPEDARILLADLVKDLQPAARLVTAEVPGEALEGAIRAMMLGQTPSDPVEQAAAWLMERGERLVLLLDPTAERTDALYEGLFRSLRDALMPRALNAVARGVRDRLEARGQKGIIDEFERAAARADRDAARKKAAQQSRERWQERITELGRAVTGDNPREALQNNEDTLRSLEQAWQQAFPQDYANATAFVREREFTVDAIVQYCRGLVKNTVNPKRWPALAAVLVEKDLASQEGQQAGRGHEREIAQATAEVLEAAGVPKAVRIDLGGDLSLDREVKRFPRLKSVACCVTKSDAIPLVHPPSEDPKRRFPRTSGPLREVEAFLKLDGGDVTYYHTSATGYSLDTGMGRVPGPPGSLTPVNVLEPVLEGLIPEETRP